MHCTLLLLLSVVPTAGLDLGGPSPHVARVVADFDLPIRTRIQESKVDGQGSGIDVLRHFQQIGFATY
jgi:hypothetical protein